MHGYSKQNSKKSKQTIRFILPLLFFLVLVIQTPAQQTVLRLSSSDDQLRISMFLVEYSPADIFSRLEEGLRSEIAFSIHVYRETRGILRLFTQRLVHDETYVQQARWDAFTRRYVLERESGEIATFTRKEDFISAFFSLKDIPLRFNPERGEKYYTLGKINVETIVFLPPLNILSSIIPDNIVSTGWERRDLPVTSEDIRG